MPSVSRVKSCFNVVTRAALGFRGGPAGPPTGIRGSGPRPGAPGAAAALGAGAPGVAAPGVAAPRAARRGRRRSGGGRGRWRRILQHSSPLKPDAVGPLSCAGISSLRRYLSGSSTKISNSIGTRLSPLTWRVRPVAVKVLTAVSFFSPPSASRALARMAAGSLLWALLRSRKRRQTPRGIPPRHTVRKRALLGLPPVVPSVPLP